MHRSNFGVRRATLKPELEHGKQIWSQGWEHKTTQQVIYIIGADIMDPMEFLWLQNSARSAARKQVTLLLLALRKLPRKRSQKRSPEVVRFAGQSSALQLPKRASC